MEFSIMDYMLSISGTIILLLLSGIAFFLKQFASSVKDLKTTVDELSKMLYVAQERINNTKDSLNVSIDQLENNVSILTTKVDIIDKEVAILKVLQDNKSK
jgi:hypothetical protein